MGKVLKIREVGDPILNKISDEVDIENINEESLEIIEDLKSTLEFWYWIRNCCVTNRYK